MFLLEDRKVGLIRIGCVWSQFYPNVFFLHVEVVKRKSQRQAKQFGLA